MTSKNIHKLYSGNNSVSKEFRGDLLWKSTKFSLQTLQTRKTQLLDVTNIQTCSMSTIVHISYHT